MARRPPDPVVHLELHTRDGDAAGDFLRELVGWRPQRVCTPAGSYLALGLGPTLDGGIVECETARPLWLPYVEVEGIQRATERARELGAAVILEPREGPSGWRSALATPAGGELALWQPKRP
jgi:uncharacterized protein